MKTKFFLLFLAMFILMSNLSHAQFGAVRRAINRQIDHKVDSSIDKNAQDERDKKAKEESEQGKNENAESKDKSGSKRGLFGGKMDINYRDNYDFTGRIYMQMESHENKDVTKADYFTYFSTTAKNAGIEVMPTEVKNGEKAVPTIFLFDGDNRCFLMLMESGDSKTGIISTIPSDSAIAAQSKKMKEPTKEKSTHDSEVPSKPTITKTGNSRIIAGFRCDEYKVASEDKEGYANVWMTKDIKLKADNRYWGKAGVPTFSGYPEFEGAMMLAMESFDKDNKLLQKMETIEINNSFNHSVSTVGYTFMKLNFGQAGKK
jgi:hypothetical protein